MIKKYFLKAIFLLLVTNSFLSTAQNVYFKNINTTHGLTSNFVYEAIEDQNGLLWILAKGGISVYDGTNLITPQTDEFKNLNKQTFRNIELDKDGWLWLRSWNGDIGYLDKNRVYHDLKLKGKVLLKLSNGDVDILTTRKHVHFDKISGQQIVKFHFDFDIIEREPYQSATQVEDRIIISSYGRAICYNARRGNVDFIYKLDKLYGAIFFDKDHLLVSTKNYNELFLVRIKDKKIIKNFGKEVLNFSPPVRTYFRNICKITERKILISSGFGGVFLFDLIDKNLTQYKHDVFDESSISADNTMAVFKGKNGNNFITTITSGLNLFNINQGFAGHVKVIKDNKENIYFDGFVSCVAKDSKGNLWLGTHNGIIKKDSVNNRTYFLDKNRSSLESRFVTCIYIDTFDRIWIGREHSGLSVLNVRGKEIEVFNTKSNPERKLRSNMINSICLGPDGLIWIGTGVGIQKINTQTLKVIDNSSIFKIDSLPKSYINHIIGNSHSLFVSTSKLGFFQITKDSIFNFKDDDFLKSKNIRYILPKDNYLYVGASNGIYRYNYLLGKYQPNYKFKTQFPYSINAINDEIWIANRDLLLKFSEIDKSLKYYGEGVGLKGGGFRKNASFNSDNKYLYFGTNKGYSFFNPRILLNTNSKLNIWISSIGFGENRLDFTSDDTLKVPYQDRNIAFSFNNIDLWNDKKINYSYRLNKNDDWIKTGASTVEIQKLKPGNYTLEVKGGISKGKWIVGKNKITIKIDYPWWRQYWFYTIIFILLGYFSYKIIDNYRNKILTIKENNEFEEALSYFSASLHKHINIEDICWDVTENCISKLNFEDCVIYLLDEETNMFIQKAVWGNKLSTNKVIKNPISINWGEGIVGDVALNAKGEIVNDTSSDLRYLVDDEIRYSELVVPIFLDGKVIGMIDSEHSTKGFFKQKHLTLLSTVSTLISNKISASILEQEKSKINEDLKSNLQKLSISEMKTLRAQMNPHFIFNCLNSINNIILQNDMEKAYDYLSGFARLMRLILNNSRNEWVLLSDELEAIELYIDLEKMRFENVFSFNINIDPLIDPLNTVIPTMLIQPFIENAIWHGLLPQKDKECHLSINISKVDKQLVIIIKDNGIGYTKSKSNKLNRKHTETSLGIELIKERMAILNSLFNIKASYKIKENESSYGGTSIVVSFKLKNVDFD